MEMEDHHRPHQHPQQHLEYGTMGDLRHLMNAPRSLSADLFPAHPNLTPTHHYDALSFGRHQLMADIMPRGLHDSSALNTSISVATPAAAASTPTFSAFEADTSGGFPGDASTARWPRQETLTLLEIRSRLDSKFRHANQKGPLWDELSRIMAEEYGYQRSGKKCREKFENLYKYYKKTKEGKAGRQDGKHYRFFRQLEALYGESNNPTSVQETNLGGNSLHFHTPSQTNQDIFNRHCDSVSLTNNSTEVDTSSSDENDSMEKRRKRRGRSWKVKIKELIDSEMKKVMEKQEAWLERLMKTLEEKEKERALREEEWSRQEAARLDNEHKFWAKERAWIEARDAALMDALQKLTGREIRAGDPTTADIQNYSENQNEDGSEILHSTDRVGESWTESEITTLFQVRAEVESRFGQSGCPEEVLWEEVANKMTCFGYHKAASVCKDKWESIRSYYKKRKQNSASFYLETNNQSPLYNQASVYCDVNQQRQIGSSPSNSNVGNAARADSCFPLFMCEGENMWENFGLKFNKGNQNP
ncbi:trihelix transcription factor PTL-like [Neltuma alba]|uniref:trihelix transcription factor PTL-like n=2 Tax=Neltuma alba TaxID=207710 RepID=UPI0010A41C59|nr:trihelix transcription factor PTL-like [Prosopis alba]